MKPRLLLFSGLILFGVAPPALVGVQSKDSYALRDTDAQGTLDETESAARLKPEYFPTDVLCGQLLEAANQPELAIEEYRAAAERASESALAEFGLGPRTALPGPR